MSHTQKTQLEKANEILTVELYENVTAADRQAARSELEVSEFTVVQYLRGRGKRTDTAVRLVDFFRKRIERRETKLMP